MLQLRHADARVAHFEAQPGAALLAFGQADGHHHLAALGKLDGVAGQVDEDLLQALGVAHQAPRHVGLDGDGQFQLLFARIHGHRRGQRVHDLVEVELDGRQLHAARLDLRIVEHVVEDAQQRLARHAHHGQILALFRIEPGIAQQIHHAQHGIEGRADFMAHVGHEIALRAVGRLGPVALLFQLRRTRFEFLLQAVAFAHQAVERFRQFADLVALPHRHGRETAAAGAHGLQRVAQAHQRRQQAHGDPAQNKRGQQRSEDAPQHQPVQHAIERFEGIVERQRGGQQPVHRFQAFEAVDGRDAAAVGADHAAFAILLQQLGGGQVGVRQAWLQQTAGIGVQHVARHGAAREDEVIAALADLFRTQASQQVVLVQAQHADHHAGHLAIGREHGRHHLHDGHAARFAQHRLGDHGLARAQDGLEILALGDVDAGAPRHFRHVGHDGALRIEHQHVVEQYQHRAARIVFAQLGGPGDQFRRLLPGRQGDDLQQHAQLVVELGSGAGDQGRLLAQQYSGEVGAHVLHLYHGDQRDHGDRGQAGGQRDFCFDAERLHDFLFSTGRYRRQLMLSGIFLSMPQLGKRHRANCPPRMGF